MSMSDPVTNVEMQDVLSSIRRLVTENTRSTPRKEFPVEKAEEDDPQLAETSETADEPADDGRLVLTPSLRVMPPPDAESDADEPSDETDVAADDLPVEDNEDIGDVDTPDDAPESVSYGEIDDETLEKDLAEALDLSDDTADGSDLTALDMPWLKPSEEDTSAEDTGATAPEEKQEEIQARFEAVEQVVEDDYEPDLPGDSANAGTATTRLDWQDPEDIDTDDLDMAEAYEEMSEQLEEGAREYVGRAVEKELGSDIGILPDDAQIMDEDALRDLVADIVRQELQGALGERITRNVRKLVRREIHRALAAAELE
ncbi:hypothetical protein [Shimia biformata]|uniref:hypothetical protein n=1 Tax=Shimia biformata TaxID=1294299 RepID=UPI001EF2D112|nr:hypothetical protein [Shimia biformata]